MDNTISDERIITMINEYLEEPNTIDREWVLALIRFKKILQNKDYKSKWKLYFMRKENNYVFCNMGYIYYTILFYL